MSESTAVEMPLDDGMASMELSEDAISAWFEEAAAAAAAAASVLPAADVVPSMQPWEHTPVTTNSTPAEAMVAAQEWFERCAAHSMGWFKWN